MERELVEYLQAMEQRMTVNLATVVRDEVTGAVSEHTQKLGASLRSEMSEDMQKLGSNLRSEMSHDIRALGRSIRNEVAEEIDGRFKHVLETIHLEKQELAAEIRVETRVMLTEFATTIVEQIQELRREISGVHEDHRCLAEMFGVHELEIRWLKEERGYQYGEGLTGEDFNFKTT